MYGFDIFWLLFLFLLVLPSFRQWNLERLRQGLIKKIEQKRRSRVITLIHRQESIGFLGMFARNFISIEDSEEVLRAIKLTPKDMPIDLIIHTPGGILLAAEQIANALSKHDAKVTVFVPHYAMSGGTLIALAADEIVMDENAVLGPVDPQIGQYAAVSILKVLEQKPISEVDDNTIILADMSKKAITQTRRFVYDLLISNDVPEEKAEELSTALTDGRWTHDYPIMYEEAKRLGLNVTSGIPEEVASLMHLYPQAGQRRPSVQYVPMPYQRPTSNGKE
ncbi:serine protease, ClpP class [Acetomicrobium thermoterrenum DSM 13490]|jgi:ClpP class serine protease|uniref:Serine protease, ClpP class n=1 Tax=Acetomicrobium thermoterrenum DSM 13490 TaxID=1120987 RepID=A0A1H3EBH7_9BACT|nr:ATP-dependent Clp protease proteolytic subunit [Acetomicrobium thermoterrenum]SDX75967.1 serine protease, ClpP class [Acetomicrobium thermoterrenum DSM 13490]